MSIVNRIWNMPPRDIARKIRRRLSGDRSIDLEEILTSPKHMRPQRGYDFFSRYEAIISRTHDWQPINFEGARVLEIGSGPVLGFGPMALFRGAAHYTAVEPDFDDRILDDDRFTGGYLDGVHKDLSGLFGVGMTLAELAARVKDHTRIVREYLLDADLGGPFDIVLSNSCLEHISPFGPSLRALHKFCAPDCRFVHLVDFGSHRPGENPFQDIYNIDRAAYAEQYGQLINLLRPSEVLKEMREAGFDAGFTPYYSMPENFTGPLHASWSSRFAEDELFTKAGIIFGPLGGRND